MVRRLNIDDIIDKAMDNIDKAIDKGMGSLDKGMDSLDRTLENLPKGVNISTMKDGKQTKITINGREYTEDTYGNIVKLPFNMFWLIGKIIKYGILLAVCFFMFSIIREIVIKTKYEVKTLNPSTSVEQPATTPAPAAPESLKKL